MAHAVHLYLITKTAQAQSRLSLMVRLFRGGNGMIISDEEWLKFIKNGQKFALEILGEDFKNDDEEVE